MLGQAAFLETAWRPSQYAPAHVVVVPANYGTHGSYADVRRRRTDVILSPPEPRRRLFNGLVPMIWRLRVVDAAKVSAVEAQTPLQYGDPVSFTSPRTASLLTAGRLPK